MPERGKNRLYLVLVGLAFFSGVAQMPIMKRYYIADVPGLAWTADFFVTSDLHYLAVAALLALLAWRLTGAGAGQATPGPGPRGGWAWLWLGLLVVSGALKAYKNTGGYLPPALLVANSLTHLTSAFALVLSPLARRLAGRRAPVAA